MPKTDSDRKTRPKKRKKNRSLELLRKVTESMANSVPIVSDETIDTIDDTLARPLSGLMSQYMGVDPVTGEVVNPLTENLKRSLNSDKRRKQGLPRQPKILPGIVADTMSLPNILGNGPEWSQRAQELADQTHSNVGQDMGLAPAQGFLQNALEAGGMMAGQIPVVGQASKAPPVGQGALKLMQHYGRKVALSPFEFLSPTVDPRGSNYLMGTVAGGGLGMLGDDVPAEEPRVHKAEGGKVKMLTELLRAFSVNPDATVRKTQHVIGDPVEEILQATNEGQRKGVLGVEEARQIKDLMARGEEEKLTEALLDLQNRLMAVKKGIEPGPRHPAITTRAAAPNGYGELPGVNAEIPLLNPSIQERVISDNPATARPAPPPNGWGSNDPDEYNRTVLGMEKATGGKVKLIDNLVRMLKERDIDAYDPEWGIVDENGNFDVDEAKATLDDAIGGEMEVDDLAESLGDPTDLAGRIRHEVSGGDVPPPLPTRRLPQKPEEMTDVQWARIRNRMKDWKIQSVADLEDLQPNLQPENLRLKTSRGKAVSVLKNPKSQDEVVRWAGREVPEVRFMTDQDGNTYVWDAREAIHRDLMAPLGLDRKGLFHEMSDTPIPPSLFDEYFFTNPWE